QNDLDYYLVNGHAQDIYQGDKYGYDYYAYVYDTQGWLNGAFTLGRFNANLGISAGANTFWREGLMRKGLFAGLDDEGNEMFWGNQKLTSYDADGKVISSKGKSEVCNFFSYSAKAGLSYTFAGGHRISANAGYFNDAPTFNQAFMSPRTRNSIIPNLTTTKTMSADLNYQYSHNGYNARVTAFWTKIKDQTDVMSFYDDSQHSFTNFAMSGIDQRHAGIELGIKAPLPVEGLTVSGVLSLGEYIYTSNPLMTQTIDNSTEVIFENQELKYWKSTPILKKATLADGSVVYDRDPDGNYITEKEQKHYVPSTPQLASELALNYRLKSYWFFELNGQYFANSYLDMNPLYRTDMACAGPDGIITPVEIEYMTSQEKFDPAFLLNASIGKSWMINRHYNYGFSLEVKNILNQKDVKTGGYEQTRLIKSTGNDRYYRFDQKYFYMCGINYMLNLYLRF
ncbi:MAG: TonB-dependent receptor, partial [Bacteroidales bacterium]|nr:TonB-dependent receptor [Bacteroidales bacterium]